MKIELDKIRAFYAHKYNSIGKGIGKGDKVARAIVQAWVESDRPLVVIWGAPGSGKSTALNGMDTSDSMVFETTGLNKPINNFLLALPRKQVTFVRHTAPQELCEMRVKTRKNNPLTSLETDNGEYMVGLVKKWFETAMQALPVDKETK